MAKRKRKTRHKRIVAELIEDLGGNVRPLDRHLVEQAGWLLIQGEDFRRSRNRGKDVPEESITRCTNGAARILLRLRAHRRDPDCRYCGMHAFYVPRSDPDKISVNVRCLDDIDLAEIRSQRFDGRNWEQSIERFVR